MKTSTRDVIRTLILSLAIVPCSLSATAAASLNGSAGIMPAYYDGRLFTINFKEEPPDAEAALLAHNGSLNFIFMSDPGLPGDQPFVSVLDAIQGEGFNPLWEEIQVTFNAGFTPRQLLSDDEIAAAAGGGEVTLSETREVYRCAVVGPKPDGGHGGLNGAAGVMPAYYDDRLFQINFKELPPNAEQEVLARNPSLNTIFMSDPGLPGGAPFESVLDAIQGDGFNPLWEEVQVTFNPGVTPRQLTSDEAILQAAEHGEITLDATGEVYRCAVVGQR